MTAGNTSRQPKGVPVGGQFAATAHSEPELTLTAPGQPDLGDVLAAQYVAGKKQYDAYAQSQWADEIRAKYPEAAFACVVVKADGEGSYTDGMDLFKADGSDIALDDQDEVEFEAGFDTHWDMGVHATEETAATFVREIRAFSLDSAKNHWAGIQASPAPSVDPFARLAGMNKARAQSAYAQELNREATAAYVQDISAKLLAINPEFARLYVNRKADVESGLTFTLDRVEDIHRNAGDVDLSGLEEHGFQDIHLDPFVDYDDATAELYINIDPGN